MSRQCRCCNELVNKSQFPKLLDACHNKHSQDERICNLCWKKYFSVAMMPNPTKEIPCLKCMYAGGHGVIDYERDFKKIADEIAIPQLVSTPTLGCHTHRNG